MMGMCNSKVKKEPIRIESGPLSSQSQESFMALFASDTSLVADFSDIQRAKVRDHVFDAEIQGKIKDKIYGKRSLSNLSR